MYCSTLYGIYLHTTHQTSSQCLRWGELFRPLPPFAFWSHLSISSELKKKKKEKKENLKKALVYHLMSFSCLLVPFKTSFLSPFIFSFQRFLSLAGHKWHHILSSFQEIQEAIGVCEGASTPFLSWKMYFDLKAGLNDACNTKKKCQQSNRLCRDDKANMEEQRDCRGTETISSGCCLFCTQQKEEKWSWSSGGDAVTPINSPITAEPKRIS